MYPGTKFSRRVAYTADGRVFGPSPAAVMALLPFHCVRNRRNKSDSTSRINSDKGFGVACVAFGGLTTSESSEDVSDSMDGSLVRGLSPESWLVLLSDLAKGTAAPCFVVGDALAEGRQQESILLHGVPPAGKRSKQGVSGAVMVASGNERRDRSVGQREVGRLQLCRCRRRARAKGFGVF